jgi:penicillin-binding protein-related factor A (putative recombinase)
VLEKTVKAAVKKRLKELGAFQFWPVQMGLGEATLDCLGCYQGKFFSVETKRPGGKLTTRQKFTIVKMREAGALVFVIDNVADARRLFDGGNFKG